jgi:AI-2 transport protein TqsA
MENIKLPFYAHLALTLTSLVLIVVILMVGSNLFIPIVFALLAALLLYPMTRFFESKLRMSRGLASILSLFIFIVGLGGVCYFLTFEIINFSHGLPKLQQRFQEIFSNIQQWLKTKYHINTKEQTDYLNRSATTIAGTVANSIGNIFLSVGQVLLWLVFIFIYTFFMLFHRNLLVKFLLHLFRVKYRAKVNEVIGETRMMINSYIIGLLIEMVLVSFVNSVAFVIEGVQYGILLGILAAVLNIIPYLGIYTSIGLTMLVTFANASGTLALEAGITLFAVHMIDANVLMPRIVGSRVKMNPFITIVAVVVGEFIWGVPGMFLFIPLIGIIKLICERVDGLEAWAILIGVNEKEKPIRKLKISAE